MSKVQSTEQLQIKLINELSKLQYNFKTVKQTIILYDLFQTLENDSVYLHNLHTIAQVMIDKSLKINIEKIQIEYQSYFDQLTIDSDSAAKDKIIKTHFQVQQCKQGEAPPLNNIFLYQIQGGDIRVVVIPIQKDLTDINKLREEQEKLEKENKDKVQQFKDTNLQFDALKDAQAAWEIIKQQKFQESCKQAQDKHLKMFKIQAFVATILQKTETYSICSLVEVTMRRYPSINRYLSQQFTKIFNVPKTVSPQFIFYNYNPKAKSANQGKHQLVTTRFQSINKKFQIGQFECWNSKYFCQPINVRTRIYENMEKSDNKAINKVIQDFVDSWNNITVNTVSCLATIVKLVNKYLNTQKNTGTVDVNSSVTDLNSSSTQISNAYTFPDIFEKYIHRSLWFPQKKQEKLTQFYTDQRLGKKIKVEKGYPKIPSSIQCLVFIHFFYQLISDFSQKYRLKEIACQNDQIQLLKLWKENLKQLYQLVNAINKTFLNTTQNKDYHSQNMQRFFNFLMFTFNSSEKMKKITKRDIATASSLKALFEQFKPKKDKLLSFIIANEESIKADEPIHYYDLYLLIIKQNARQDIQNDLQYIELHIHELKAFRIASQYIWDNQKLVEAIKSYALIALKYQKLNENKRKLIDILQIEKRMARLLKIIGQEQAAADVYFKNRDLYFANNCCKQVLSKYKGDGKATLLIRWGQKFQKQFQYDLANSYYLMAFSYAKSHNEKANALSHKMKLIQRRNKLPTEDERSKHDKFIIDQNLQQFCSEMKLGELFNKLRKYLTWDAISGCSVISKSQQADKDLELSMIGSVSQMQATSEATQS